MGPHPVAGVFTRGEKLGHRDTQREMPSAKEVEDGLMHLHTEERQGSLASGDGGSRQGTASWSLQRVWLCQSLDFRILAFRAVR